jgi:hypothetical protein
MQAAFIANLHPQEIQDEAKSLRSVYEWSHSRFEVFLVGVAAVPASQSLLVGPTHSYCQLELTDVLIVGLPKPEDAHCWSSLLG